MKQRLVEDSSYGAALHMFLTRVNIEEEYCIQVSLDAFLNSNEDSVHSQLTNYHRSCLGQHGDPPHEQLTLRKKVQKSTSFSFISLFGTHPAHKSLSRRTNHSSNSSSPQATCSYGET